MKTEFHRIKLSKSYGHYIIIGQVNGQEIETTTTNADLFDSYNSDESPYYSEIELKEICEELLELEVSN